MDLSRFSPSSFLYPLSSLGYCIIFSHCISGVLFFVYFLPFPELDAFIFISYFVCLPLWVYLFSHGVLRFGFGGGSGETVFLIAPILDGASGHTMTVMDHVVWAVTVWFLH